MKKKRGVEKRRLTTIISTSNIIIQSYKPVIQMSEQGSSVTLLS